MSVLVLVAAQFATIIRNDPITLERQAVFAVEEDGNIFGLACRPGKAEIDIIFSPRHYRGVAKYQFMWTPRADSRFSTQDKAEENAWYLGDQNMTYVSSALGSITGKASFLDYLAKDREFNIRYEAWPGDVQTATIRYSLDQETLREFIARCGPKKVIGRLKEMQSPAAPE